MSTRGAVIVILLLVAVGVVIQLSIAKGSHGNAGDLKLVWSDEFDSGAWPDTTKWGYDVGDGCPNICGWGNNELQYYMANRASNARIENGHLIIEAHREPMGTKEYTSARLVSKHKGDWTYGKIVASAKLPKGLGVWPAIWMLPTDWKYGGWPASGEIDIMEHVGYMPDSLFGSIHTKRFNHIMGTQVTKGVYSTSLSDAFHEYGIEWDAEKIDFLFDGVVFQTFQNNKEGPDAWPFDQPFHLVLNMAVGGNWGGRKGVDTSIWPQQLIIDYVRVYQKK
jgi:beta-glucanase (GH16 family)